jgi:hypothetical protein
MYMVFPFISVYICILNYVIAVFLMYFSIAPTCLINKLDMGRPCFIYEIHYRRIVHLSENLKGRNYLEDETIDGWIILEQILQK